MTKELLTIGDFCEATSLGRTHVYELLKRGEVKAIKIGRRTFIRREDVQKWISSLTSYPIKPVQKEANHAE